MNYSLKISPITDDYILSDEEVLGVGLSGQVVSCINKETNVKYALKVLY